MKTLYLAIPCRSAFNALPRGEQMYTDRFGHNIPRIDLSKCYYSTDKSKLDRIIATKDLPFVYERRCVGVIDEIRLLSFGSCEYSETFGSGKISTFSESARTVLLNESFVIPEEKRGFEFIPPKLQPSSPFVPKRRKPAACFVMTDAQAERYMESIRKRAEHIRKVRALSVPRPSIRVMTSRKGRTFAKVARVQNRAILALRP